MVCFMVCCWLLMVWYLLLRVWMNLVFNVFVILDVDEMWCCLNFFGWLEF